MLPPELQAVEDELRRFTPRGPRVLDADAVWREARVEATAISSTPIPIWRSPVAAMLALAACALLAVLYLTFEGVHAPAGSMVAPQGGGTREEAEAMITEMRSEALIWTIVTVAAGLCLCLCLWKLFRLERKSGTAVGGRLLYYGLPLLLVHIAWLYPRHNVKDAYPFFAENGISLPAMMELANRYVGFSHSIGMLCIFLAGMALATALCGRSRLALFVLSMITVVGVMLVLIPGYNMLLYMFLGTLLTPLGQ